MRNFQVHRQRIAILASALALGNAACLPATAQDADPPRDAARFPFFAPIRRAQPDEFLENLFGIDGDVEREKLERIVITPREEQQYGRRVADAYLGTLKKRRIAVRTTGRDADYVTRLVETLQPLMRNRERYRQMRVYVADADTTDAHCFPGGILIVDRGLLDFVNDEAALVGVLGHELSHVDRGHQLDSLRRMKLSQQTFSGSNGFSMQQFWQNGPLLLKSFLRPMRPEYETEADRDATIWAHRVNYDPRALAELFRRFLQRGPRPADMMPNFLRSHPAFDQRAEAVMETFAELQATHPKTHLYRGSENLRRRVARRDRVFPE
jgi:predicted Zn-dependent protease